MARLVHGKSVLPSLRLAIALCLGGFIAGLVEIGEALGQQGGEKGGGNSSTTAKIPRNTLPSRAGSGDKSDKLEYGPNGLPRNRVSPRPNPTTRPKAGAAAKGGEMVVPPNALPPPRAKAGNPSNREITIDVSNSPKPPEPHRGNPRHHAGRDPHAGWIHGTWDGIWGSNHQWDWEGIATRAVAAGLASWKVGSAVYDWGYAPYTNPYHRAAGSPSAPFDYARPIDTESPAPNAVATDTAIAILDAARAAFKSGDYLKALGLTDKVLRTLPNDSAVHELRALALFALKRYDEAAATLHAVLSVGPGWDWTTLARLYGKGDAYTAQLRALEDYRDEHPDSASAHFVLAYHYLTAGHVEIAEEELKEAARLKPQDQLTSQLIVIVAPPGAEGVAVADQAGPDASPAVPPAPAPPSARRAQAPPPTPTLAANTASKPQADHVANAANSPAAPPITPKPDPKPEPAPASAPATLVASATPVTAPLLNAPTPLLNAASPSTAKPTEGARPKPRPPSMGEFAGRWKASPAKNVTIDLAIQPDKKFSWTVSGSQGSGPTLNGEFAYGGETLALVQENGKSMVGWLAWEDDNHFHFRIAGSIPDHPKLDFSR
ncbi:MAG: hypothetical protein ABS79_08120 [Planctomycetes bacterium SCN 63-9]|nr:MAG: hypothetical protein ABS79_08120 [Planctomycetes bacterium SCN 63-9]